ncbi:hypothetical protein DAHU10_041250 [Hanseniaspora uvarum]|nr:hypothetical protein DAHU10_041250 [Hanseniaspora uvarum]
MTNNTNNKQENITLMNNSEGRPLLKGKKQRPTSVLKTYLSVPADTSKPISKKVLDKSNGFVEYDTENINNLLLNSDDITHEPEGLAKYLTILQWLPKYEFSNFPSDLISSLTLTAFQIPMVLSLSHMANCSPKSGLYSLIFPPLVYALVGNNCYELVIGPQILPSLAVSEAIQQISSKANLFIATKADTEKLTSIPVNNIVGMISFTSGLILLYLGLSKQGFLDNIMSRSFQRGLISSLAIIVFINSLLQQLDLNKLFKEWLVEQHIHGVGSSWEKCSFIYNNWKDANSLTFGISMVSLAFLIGTRIIKQKYVTKYPKLLFFPEILLFVIVSTIASKFFKWDIPLVGELLKKDNAVYLMNPLTKFKLFKEVFHICIFVSAVGLFESAAAYKSLSDMDGKRTREIASNKEISVIGIANIVCGLFCSLPSFAGYGRTKLNCLSGCKTPLSGVMIALFTFIITKYFLHWFNWLPECSLSCVISYISYTLLEELPKDLAFYIRVKGYKEILLVFIIILSTIVWSPQLGISVGLIISMSGLLKQTTKSKICILGKDINSNQFKPVHLTPGNMERTYSDSSSIIESGLLHRNNTNLEFERIMIVETPRSLNFANINDMKKQLIKLEKYGPNSSSKARSGSLKDPFTDDSSILTNERSPLKYLIIDLENLIEIDVSALLGLSLIMSTYHKRGILVFFAKSYRLDLVEQFTQSRVFHYQQMNIKKWMSKYSVVIKDQKELVSNLHNYFFDSVEQCIDCIDSMEYIASHN